MDNKHGDIEGVLTNFETGGMSRRRFLERMTALGVSTAVANAVLLSPLGVRKAFAAIGGPEERAWALAKEAAAKATKKTLTVLIPTGSIGNMTPYVDKWKNELGIQLVFIEEPDEVVHTKGMQEAVAKTGSYDVMMPTAMSYPDWIESGVIYDLTDWVQKYDPELFNPDWGVVFSGEPSCATVQWPRCRPALRRRPDHRAVPRRLPQEPRQDEGVLGQVWLCAGRPEDVDGIP